jgi:hypothetical protein
MEKQLPSAPRFLLADNITEQSGGKLLIIGLYSGDVVVLHGPLPAKVPAQFHGIALPGLYVLVTFVDGVGQFDASVRIYDPNGIALGPASILKAKLEKGKSQNFVVPLVPFPVTAFGKYRIELQIDTKKFGYEFAVQHEDPNAALPSIQSKKTSSKKPVKSATGRVKVSRKQK